MNPWLIALTIGATLLGAAILFFSITRIFALLRDSEVARLPAVSQGQVSFPDPGTYTLHIEQPRLNTALLDAQFVLRDPAQSADVRSSPVIFRTTSSGFSTASLAIRQFEIEHPGVYRLFVSGIDPAGDLSRIQLVFTRPYATKLFVLIVCIVLGGGCLIGGLVFSALQYAGKI
jgi:hypothetical protein